MERRCAREEWRAVAGPWHFGPGQRTLGSEVDVERVGAELARRRELVLVRVDASHDPSEAAELRLARASEIAQRLVAGGLPRGLVEVLVAPPWRAPTADRGRVAQIWAVVCIEEQAPER